MKGIADMMAGMLGMSPGQMQDLADRVSTGVLELAEKTRIIDEKQDQILANQERIIDSLTSDAKGAPENDDTARAKSAGKSDGKSAGKSDTAAT